MSPRVVCRHGTRRRWFGRGHTNGDTITYFPDLKTIHARDLIIDAIPVIDYPGGGSALAFSRTVATGEEAE